MESASASIDEKIKQLGDWRGKTLAHLRQLIHDADPGIQEEWKWAKPASPGTPVWSHDGIVCTGETYKQVVKLTFARGASIEDPKNSSIPASKGTCGVRSTSAKGRRSTKLPSGNSFAPRWRPTPQRSPNGQPKEVSPAVAGETKMSERSGTPADNPFNDPFSGRSPTSHERMTGKPWDASYSDGPAHWDIGRPQPAIVRLASKGGFAGAVLDAGCGTGEHALLIASLGLPVLGVDVAETALATAREKAARMKAAQKKTNDGGVVEFATADALHMERLGRRFDTVLDCGLFHTFDDDERPRYVASLASVTERDGTVYVLCFSDDGPDTVRTPSVRKR